MMEFDKLSKAEKSEYFKEIENDIHCCLSLFGDCVPDDVANNIQEYLSHNELGIALEILADLAIKYSWNIGDEAKIIILNTFKKMDYHISDRDQYESYKKSLNKL